MTGKPTSGFIATGAGVAISFCLIGSFTGVTGVTGPAPK